MTHPGSIPRVVAVTGAAGYIGARLVRHLADRPEVERIVAVDRRPLAFDHPKITALQQDILEPLDRAFVEHRVEALVHLAFVIRQQRRRKLSHHVNVDGTDSVLRAAAAAQVRRLVYLSSATVYGALADNPQPLTEDSRARPTPNFHYAWDKREAERAFEGYASDHPEAVVSTLRGSIVMGASADNSITQALSRPVLIGVRGHDPGIQFTHDEDLVALLWRFVAEAHPGVYNVAGPGVVRWSELGRMARKRIVWLPAWLAYGITDLSWALRIQSDAPSAGLDYVRWPWAVSTDKLERELGFAFTHTSKQALAAWLGLDAAD